MSTHYELLTDGEQAHWDEYANLRAISDWPGFTEDQDERRADARAWLQEKRKQIWRLAQPEEDGGDGQGWDHAHRRERYETLKDENLNGSTVQRQETTLPANYGLDTERAVIEEREIWWQIDSTTDDQKVRKQACTDWLIARRKKLWHLMQDDPDGNEANHRQRRYDNLCIATKHGSAYEDWDAGHDEYGKANAPDDGPDDGRSDSGTRRRLSDHFTVEEFDCHDGTQVPSAYYGALEYLCETFLEPLRKSYGSVNINSGYRTPSYNAGIGGASNSFHIYTAHDDDDPAADVSCATGSASQWHAKLDAIRQSERNGNGGLGRYSTFVHVDLRDYPSDWTG